MLFCASSELSELLDWPLTDMGTGWISTSEKLPHWTEWVAVETDSGHYGEGWFNDDWNVWCIESQWELQGDIVRWKPKPEGPDFGPPLTDDEA